METVNEITSKYLKQLVEEFADGYYDATQVNVTSEDVEIEDFQKFFDWCHCDYLMNPVEVEFVESSSALDFNNVKVLRQLPDSLKITPLDIVNEIRFVNSSDTLLDIDLGIVAESSGLRYYDQWQNGSQVRSWLELRLLPHTAALHQVVWALAHDADVETEWDLMADEYELESDQVHLLSMELISECIRDVKGRENGRYIYV